MLALMFYATMSSTAKRSAMSRCSCAFQATTALSRRPAEAWGRRASSGRAVERVEDRFPEWDAEVARLDKRFPEADSKLSRIPANS
jgi:hypothetical protein